ncbi:hypothetical protein DRA43_33215, partial [Micromonospora provocatoris]
MISLVVPTLGRPSLAALLDTLAAQLGEKRRDETSDVELLLVDDRGGDAGELAVPGALTAYTKVLTGRGAGPAAAREPGLARGPGRNGWSSSTT